MLRSLLLASTCLLAACATTAPDALVAPPPAEDAAVATPVAAPRDQAAELKRFFIDVAEASKLPVILYNFVSNRVVSAL